MSASETLRTLRHACGLGQEQWAAFIGVGRKTVQRWEAGTAVPDARAETAIVELCVERGVLDLADLQSVLVEARVQHHVSPRLAPPSRVELTGRGRDVNALRDALVVSRLVTLVGPAGVGKTTLAFAAADGAVGVIGDARVLLAPLRDVGLVLSAIADAMSLRQTKGRSLRDTVVAGLQQATLLVLDNCEHLPGVGDIVDDLLQACPALRVLATSRRPLRRLGEHVYEVAPLGPDAAVVLFERTAQTTAPSFMVTDSDRTVVAELCERLDRLPLAIELIAPRVRVVSPASLLAHLGRRLELLRSRATVDDDRHASLEAAIAWSYDLLDDGQRRLFRSLGVFTGAFTAEAAIVVAGGDAIETMDGLDVLLDHNLLRRVDDVPRLSMLETLRAFALDQLARAAETEDRLAAHATYHAELAGTDAALLHGPDQLAALDRLSRAYADMCAALSWLFDHDPATGLDLAVALAPYWDAKSTLSEGRDWLARAMAYDKAAWFAKAAAATWASYLAALQGDFDVADRHATAALQIWTAHEIDAGRGYALLMLGFVAVERERLEAGQRLLSESLAAFDRGGDRWGKARPLNNLGELARLRGDLDTAEQLHGQALAIVRESGDLGSQPNILCGLGHVHLARGHPAAARPLAREAIEISETLRNRLGTAAALELLGLAHLDDHPGHAAQLLGAAHALRQELDAPVESRDRVVVEDAGRLLEHTEHWRAGTTAPIDDIVRESTQLIE